MPASSVGRFCPGCQGIVGRTMSTPRWRYVASSPSGRVRHLAVSSSRPTNGCRGAPDGWPEACATSTHAHTTSAAPRTAAPPKERGTLSTSAPPPVSFGNRSVVPRHREARPADAGTALRCRCPRPSRAARGQAPRVCRTDLGRSRIAGVAHRLLEGVRHDDPRRLVVQPDSEAVRRQRKETDDDWDRPSPPIRSPKLVEGSGGRTGSASSRTVPRPPPCGGSGRPPARGRPPSGSPRRR